MGYHRINEYPEAADPSLRIRVWGNIIFRRGCIGGCSKWIRRFKWIQRFSFIFSVDSAFQFHIQRFIFSVSSGFSAFGLLLAVLLICF